MNTLTVVAFACLVVLASAGLHGLGYAHHGHGLALVRAHDDGQWHGEGLLASQDWAGHGAAVIAPHHAALIAPHHAAAVIAPHHAAAVIAPHHAAAVIAPHSAAIVAPAVHGVAVGHGLAYGHGLVAAGIHGHHASIAHHGW